MRKSIFTTIAILLFGFLTLNAQISVLLVNDNGYDPERVEVIKTAITNAGYSFAYWDAPEQMASPDFEFLQPFDLVIWYTGNDGGSLYLWNGDETENQAVMDYIDDGGMLWLQGLDFLYDKYPEAPTTFLPGEFVYDYLGIYYYHGQSHIDDGVWSDGVTQLDVVADNGIFTINPLTWSYDAMWYVDAVEKTEEAANIYKMGPDGYDLSDYYSGIYLEKGEGKVLSFTFETARIETQEMTDQLFMEGIGYFEQFAQPGVLVEEINISTEGDVYAIEDNFGSLQFSAEVLPENASIPYIFWSVISDDVIVSIDQDGLLQASGTDNGNGTVLVKAEAMDGSGIADSVEVSISGQGTEFTVLLVNDNANGTDRHLVIDTSLMNLDYIYNVYNTVVTGEFPDYNTLDSYDAVIWYTGNDGVDLKLWDVSDTTGAVNTNLKFNAPLMQYIQQGGIVWLQGLDFIYDIYGGAFDLFDPGDFMYDFLGISAYVAQTYADGDPLPQIDAVPENPITDFTPVTWFYSEGLYYADVLDKTDDAIGIYKMGPGNYIYSDYYAGIYTNPGEGHLFTLTVETTRIDTRENTDAFFGATLEYFETLVSNSSIFENRQTSVSSFTLSPNPATSQATLNWEMKENADVQLQVYDITGRVVFQQNLGNLHEGTQQFTFLPADSGIPAGLYTCVLNVGSGMVTQKLIITE